MTDQLPPEYPPSWKNSDRISPVPARSAPCSMSSESSAPLLDNIPDTGSSPGNGALPVPVTTSPPMQVPPTASGTDPVLPDVDGNAERLAASAPPFRPPASNFPARPKGKATPMTAKGLEIAARLKEVFYAYDNRRSADNRSAQATLGPSEIGTPCDRRLAMSLLRLPPVNPGGDGWAAFVGTCVHAGLADMLLWANMGSGRYQTEVPLTLPSEHVPRGTTDLIDTALWTINDHKVMGSWSLDKLKSEGPSRTYRVQGHVYGLGARLAGYPIEDVVIIGWPRERSSLDGLYVWTEPYDPDLAREAVDRVDSIAAQLGPLEPDGEWSVPRPEDFPIDNSDCKYCPWYLKGAPRSEKGVCNGRS